jgi:uncharacterized membrane protein YgcG
MGWTNSVVTNTGVELLNESLAGHTLTIDKAVGGSGVLTPEELLIATEVTDWKQDFSLLGIEDCEGGKKVKIQITNESVEEGYELHQVAAYAKLNYEEDYHLLFIMQDDRGVEIPSYEENPDFLFEIYAVIAISNNANIKVSVDPGATVSVGYLTESISLAVTTHNADTNSHPDIRRALESTNASVELARDAASDAASAAEEAKKAADQNAKAIQTVANQQSQLVGDMVSVTVIDFEIPVSAWVKDEAATGRYTYYADVENDAVLSTQIPNVTLDDKSMEIAYYCGMKPGAETAEDGKIHFESYQLPEEPISGSCMLLTQGGTVSAGSSGTGNSGGSSGGSSGSGGGTGNSSESTVFVAEEASYATEEAVSDMLDEIFSE